MAWNQHAWTKRGERLANRDDDVRWALGDWLLEGEPHIAVYAVAEKITGLSRTHLYDLASTARRIPVSVRTEKLSWSHHRTIANLRPYATEPEIRKLLREAAREGCSVSQLADKLTREAITIPREQWEYPMPCGNKIGPFDCCSVVCGDSRELIAKLPSGAVGAVVTDPPYGVDAATWDGEVPYGLLTDFLRVTTGPVVWFGAASRMAEAFKSFDPEPQRTVIWAPKFQMLACKGQGMCYRFHPVYCWQIPSQHDGTSMDVVDVIAARHNWWNHTCTKPVELMRLLVGFAPTDGVVLDPFAGSGSTLVAAKERGQHYLGFEIDPEHVEVCNARLVGEVIHSDGGRALAFDFA